MEDVVCVGYSYVGKATSHAFGIKDWYSRNGGTVKRDDLYDFKYIFIAVPTPTINGKQDISAIEEYVGDIGFRKKNSIFIIRSTILPGTCIELAEKYKADIVHVPEFLSEDTWKKDSEWPDIVVIGSDEDRLRRKVEGIFRGRYKGAEFVVTDSVTAEMIKYAINCFYATKVIYANEVADYAEKIGANYKTIQKAMYSRQWIGENHLEIWSKGGKGAGGSCLKKDLEAFTQATGSSLLKIANDINQQLLKDYPKR